MISGVYYAVIKLTALGLGNVTITEFVFVLLVYVITVVSILLCRLWSPYIYGHYLLSVLL
jgi:hypothetical protein